MDRPIVNGQVPELIQIFLVGISPALAQGHIYASCQKLRAEGVDLQKCKMIKPRLSLQPSAPHCSTGVCRCLLPKPALAPRTCPTGQRVEPACCESILVSVERRNRQLEVSKTVENGI